jgi:hypothetical protein
MQQHLTEQNRKRVHDRQNLKIKKLKFAKQVNKL